MKSYFIPGAERAPSVRALFDQISCCYDLINDLQSFGLHRLWKKRLIRLAKLGPADSVLDICCGTADLLRHAHPAAIRTGIDFSFGMLSRAASRSSTAKINFLQGDALALPIKDEACDVILIGYGLRNLADLGQGLREMFRVLKKGGRILALDFSKPKNRILRRWYFLYLQYFVPLCGGFLANDRSAYSYIAESLEAYPEAEVITALLGHTGFVQVKHLALCAGTMAIHTARKHG